MVKRGPQTAAMASSGPKAGLKAGLVAFRVGNYWLHLPAFGASFSFGFSNSVLGVGVGLGFG